MTDPIQMATSGQVVFMDPGKGEKLSELGRKVLELLMEGTESPQEALAVLLYTKEWIEKEFSVQVALIPLPQKGASA